jgi:hypothetical protein
MARFDELFELGREAVLGRVHECDKPPVDGGRWGIAVILRPDERLIHRLAEITGDVMRIAGSHHWPTGSPTAVHFTVRALEWFRSDVPDDDPSVVRYSAALERAAMRSKPVALVVKGLTLTPSCVMACAEATGGAAGEFARALADELGSDGWLERDFRRDIWYSTLVHFAGPIDDPARLVDWIQDRREMPVAQAVFDTAQLVRYTYNGRHTELATLASVVLQPLLKGIAHKLGPVVQL